MNKLCCTFMYLGEFGELASITRYTIFEKKCYLKEIFRMHLKDNSLCNMCCFVCVCVLSIKNSICLLVFCFLSLTFLSSGAFKVRTIQLIPTYFLLFMCRCCHMRKKCTISCVPAALFPQKAHQTLRSSEWKSFHETSRGLIAVVLYPLS